MFYGPSEFPNMIQEIYSESANMQIWPVMTANMRNSPVTTANMRNWPVMTANMQNWPVMTANMRDLPVIKDDRYMSHIGHRTFPTSTPFRKALIFP